MPDIRTIAPMTRLHTPRLLQFSCASASAWLALATAIALGGCAGVPGETLASGGVRRDVTSKVLAQAAQAKPACRRSRIVDTEVVELHGDGKVALERWTVDSCDERVVYRVSFP